MQPWMADPLAETVTVPSGVPDPDVTETVTVTGVPTSTEEDDALAEVTVGCGFAGADGAVTRIDCWT